MGVLNPSGKILGSGLTYPLRGYIDGLITANAADADHDITINEGEATDSTKSTLMTLYSPLTKQIDATWAQGTNAGGLFNGVSLGNTTWYHMFQIKHSSGAIDCGFDTSVTAANRPSGWNYYRRIGSVLTNSSANIIAYLQDGDNFIWKSTVVDVNAGSIGAAASNLTISVPLGVKVRPFYSLYVQKAATQAYAWVWCPDQTYSTGIVTTYAPSAGAPSQQFSDVTGCVLTNTSSQLTIQAGHATTTLYFNTYGWIDPRGRDS